MTTLYRPKDIWLKRFLYCFTLILLFSAALTAPLGVGVRILEVALPLFCFVVDVTRIPRWIFWFMLYLAISGTIGMVRGTDSYSHFFVEFRAISINVLYYYFFFKMIRNDYERAFQQYARLAFWFAVLAFPVWIAACITAHTFVRLRGLSTEPAWFCMLILPAYYWSAYRFVTKRQQGVQVVIFTLAVIFSVSSLGYLAVALGILLLAARRRTHLLVAPLVVCALLGLAYSESSFFRTRVNDTVMAAMTLDMTGINLSTYALISNAIVTWRVLMESPLIGNGLGSHALSHARFIGNIQGLQFFIDNRLVNWNVIEAASLTLRVLSEFGILGYLCVLGVVFHFHVGGRGKHAAISNAILLYFFLMLLRGGEYYKPEEFFFIFIYILNYRAFRREMLLPAGRPMRILPLSTLPLMGQTISADAPPSAG